ncbi:HNH endonuclease [Actinacidiphila oryziradicis]|uniref:HNH endonuclease n=2 Tax=Actinacidiphila oryziradicis TaxID=2571141 RepID=A0A4U0RMF1_9ACTN|nr:HNH endonuclease [Actinacidiphila oryziradicis]
MGANSRTYKFALGAALLKHAEQGRTDVSLSELALPYATGLVEHLATGPQAPTGMSVRESDFLAVAAREAEESKALGHPTERLLLAAVRSMPAMVMQKFHNLRGGTEIPHRFYELEGSPRERIVRLTPALHKVARSEQAAGLHGELGARWNIVESSFAAGIGRSLVGEGVSVDWATLTLTDKRRRRSVTGVAEALIGFQHGRCLICTEIITSDSKIAIDHVFPFSLMRRYGSVAGWHGPDLDVIWNLAPAHEVCNSAKSDRLPTRDELQRLVQRNEAIMLSPHPLKKTLQLSLHSARRANGAEGQWPGFLRGVLAACG